MPERRKSTPRLRRGTTAGASVAASGLPGFVTTLAAPASRRFVQWAAATAAPGIVLDRDRFDPFDLRPWLGDLSILQWDPDAADYRYRLFGTHWASTMRRDFTGHVLAQWPDKLARAIRIRLDAVIKSGTPIGAHVRVARFEGDDVERGQSRFEQVLWPLSYGPGAGGAVLLLAVHLPDDGVPDDVNALSSPGYWFGADGRNLGVAPTWPG